MKDNFSALMLRIGMNPTSSESYSNLLFSHCIKSYITHFQNAQKILRKT